jgi:hypothetical protein
MNRLPKVLQNEIWEYVRGDRAFFKSQFQIVMTELSFKKPEHHLARATILQSPNLFGTVHFGFNRRGQLFRVVFKKRSGRRYRYIPWGVYTRDESIPKTIGKAFFRFEDARAEFHRQVVIAATKTTLQKL